ncbi:MAG: CoA transferase [Burkholderiales bacterium]|nr:CoA transferase [Burkholderiales bacterium]
MNKPHGPDALDGVRVLELGTTIAGPFCARLLADFGAEVIKVEALDGDPLRLAGRHFDGHSLYAKSLMRNKKLAAIDLRSPDGQDLVRRLVRKCDVVVENFRPGTLEKWGLGYSDLKKVKPDIVMVRISGYGQDGPYSARPGYGVISEAMSGLRYLNGEPGRPPVRVNLALTDYITGLYAAFGTMLALRHRDRTGKGQYVDTALYECAFSFLESHIVSYDKLAVVAQPTGPALANSAVNNLFLTSDGIHVHIQGSQTNGFRRLVVAMGQENLLDDTRFNTRRERVKHAREIDAIVQEWVGTRTYAELQRSFMAHDVTFAPIYNVADIFSDPHYEARGMLPRVEDPDIGDLAVPAPVPRLSDTPGHVRHLGHEIGCDTRSILMDLAEISSEKLAQLESDSIVRCANKT